MSKNQTIERIPMSSNGSKFWNIANNDGTIAELTLYGEIFSEQPRDFWTGEEIDELFITPKAFLEDLKTIKNAKDITVKLNSIGGDLYTGIAIHNALKSLKSNITVEVEGIAASSASIIMCAGARVVVHPGSLVMMHGVLSYMNGYINQDKLDVLMKSFETCNSAVAEIYAQKSGLATNKILKMMREETWMTGKEAVEYGFADELVEDDDIKVNFINKSTLCANGLTFDIKNHNVPDNVVKQFCNKKSEMGGKSEMSELQKFLAGMSNLVNKFTNSADVKEEDEDKSSADEKKEDDAKKEDVKEPEDKQETDTKKNENTKDTDTKAPEVEFKDSIEARLNAAIQMERTRCREIDALPIAQSLKNEAKYGATPCSAGELAMFVLQKNNPENKEALNNLNDDIKKSNSNNVFGSSATFDSLSEDGEKIAKAMEFAKKRKERKSTK